VTDATAARRNWPVLRWYDGDERRAISLPVGGIGTGTIGFGGRGEWREHELQNHPAKGSRSPGTFLAVRAVRADPAGGAGQRTSEGEVTRAGGADAGEEAGSAHRSAPVLDAGAAATARLLEGALFDEEYEGALGSPVALAGLPRFSRCRFEAAYPLGRVCLDDDGFPLAAVVEVFNPFVPGDAEASGRSCTSGSGCATPRPTVSRPPSCARSPTSSVPGCVPGASMPAAPPWSHETSPG
jgi:hypothetical protein